MSTPFDFMGQVMQQQANMLVNGIKSINNMGIQAVRNLDKGISSMTPANMNLNPSALLNPATVFQQVDRTLQQGLSGVGQTTQSLSRSLALPTGLPQPLAIKNVLPFGGLAGTPEETSFFGEGAKADGVLQKQSSERDTNEDTSMF